MARAHWAKGPVRLSRGAGVGGSVSVSSGAVTSTTDPGLRQQADLSQLWRLKFKIKLPAQVGSGEDTSRLAEGTAFS